MLPSLYPSFTIGFQRTTGTLPGRRCTFSGLRIGTLMPKTGRRQ